MKTLFLVIAVALMIPGCDTSIEKSDRVVATGALRHKLFVECMELASKMPRQADDDVSDIVEECSQQAYYMANHMSK